MLFDFKRLWILNIQVFKTSPHQIPSGFTYIGEVCITQIWHFINHIWWEKTWRLRFERELGLTGNLKIIKQFCPLKSNLSQKELKFSFILGSWLKWLYLLYEIIYTFVFKMTKFGRKKLQENNDLQLWPTFLWRKFRMPSTANNS